MEASQISAPVPIVIPHDHMYFDSQFAVQIIESPPKQPSVPSLSSSKLEEVSKNAKKQHQNYNESNDDENGESHNSDSDDEHTCTDCGKTYQHANSLKRHMIVAHTEERPFACDQCGKTFKLNAHLYQHARQHKAPQLGHECSFCGKLFDTSQAWKQHELTHALNWSQNECSVCGSRFPSKQDLRKHKEAKKCKPVTYVCCKKTFPKRRDYLLHRIQNHQDKNAKEHKCTICDKKFSFSYMLAQHQKNHAVLEASALHPKERKVVRGPRGPRPPGTQFRCKVCHMVFPDQKSVLAHSSEAHDDGEKPFKCEICGKGLTTKVALQRHERIHTQERPYPCSYCDKAFIDAESQRSHIRIHTGEKPFKCQYCDTRFRRSGNLAAHVLTHTGEKPYSCEICGKSFAQSTTLKGHMSVHGFKLLKPKKKKSSPGSNASPKKSKTAVVAVDPDNTGEIGRLLLGRGIRETNVAVSSIAKEYRATFRNVQGQNCEYSQKRRK